jgi:hypothetical protein
MKPYNRRNAGYAMVIVMGLAAVLAVLLAGVIRYSANELRISTDQADLESALYVAQTGAERGAAYVSNGGTGPTNFSGTNACGTYVVAIIPASLPTSAPRTIGGWIDLTPGGSGGQFSLRNVDDGTYITRSQLTSTFPGYTGPADWVHILPGGSGTQTGLTLDGAPYQVMNTVSYDVFASCMSVYLYNDTIDAQGHAVGHWKIAMASTCASFIVSN